MGDEVWVGWAEAFGALEAARLVGEVAREVEAAAVAAVASAVGRLEEACAVRVVRGGVFFLPWVALAPIEEAGRGPAREGVKRRRLRLRPRRDLPDQLATPSSRRHLPPDVGKGKKKSKGGSPSVPWPIRNAIRRRPTRGREVLAARMSASQGYTSPHPRPTRPTSARYESHEGCAPSLPIDCLIPNAHEPMGRWLSCPPTLVRWAGGGGGGGGGAAGGGGAPAPAAPPPAAPVGIAE